MKTTIFLRGLILGVSWGVSAVFLYHHPESPVVIPVIIVSFIIGAVTTCLIIEESKK